MALPIKILFVWYVQFWCRGSWLKFILVEWEKYVALKYRHVRDPYCYKFPVSLPVFNQFSLVVFTDSIYMVPFCMSLLNFMYWIVLLEKVLILLQPIHFLTTFYLHFGCTNLWLTIWTVKSSSIGTWWEVIPCLLPALCWGFFWA